jgi:hypothetical protein
MTDKNKNVLQFPARGEPALGTQAEDGHEPMTSSGTSGSGDGTNERLVRLETHFQYIQRDLAEIRHSLRRLPELPTKADLDSWKWQWAAIALAVIVLAITGIVGGLALINRSVDSHPSAPIVIQLPAGTHVKQP